MPKPNERGMKIGLIGWVAIVLTSLTLGAALLLVYLIVTTPARTPKEPEATTEDPRLVAQEADDSFHLALEKAKLEGQDLVLEDRAIGEVIAGLKSTSDRISWRLKLKKAGIYEIVYTYSNAFEKGEVPGKIKFSCNGQSFTAAVRPTGGVLGTVSDREFLKLEPAGEVTLELSAESITEGELLTLKKIVLIPQLRQRKKS